MKLAQKQKRNKVMIRRAVKVLNKGISLRKTRIMFIKKYNFDRSYTWYWKVKNTCAQINIAHVQ